MCFTPVISSFKMLIVWSWLSSFGCHTEELSISWSVRLRDGGSGQVKGTRGEFAEGNVTVGDKAGGRECVAGGVTSVCRTGDKGVAGVGDRGGGRDAGGLKQTVGDGLTMGERGGGRDGGVAGGRGGRDGSWDDFGAGGGGGLGRNGRDEVLGEA